MTDYTARNVLLKDSSGNYLIPYTEKADLSLGNLNSAGKAYVAIKGYDSTATYSLNEVVMTVVSGSVLFYRSLVDNNTASLSDTTKWSEVSFGSGANIDLSNLSNTGEAHFANPSLSNLNATGEAHFAKPNFSNATKPYVTETYHSGTTWHIVFSDGFKMQGGAIGSLAVGASTTVYFSKPFSGTNYFCCPSWSSASYGAMGWTSRSTTGMTIQNASGGASTVYWMACGY